MKKLIAMIAVVTIGAMAASIAINSKAEQTNSEAPYDQDTGCSRPGRTLFGMFNSFKSGTDTSVTKFPNGHTVRTNTVLKVRIAGGAGGGTQKVEVVEIHSSGVSKSLIGKTLILHYALCFTPTEVGAVGLISGTLSDEETERPKFQAL
jgi:hypothetical protein